MERGKFNKKFKWAIILTLILWVIIIGLFYSSIGHADRPTDEEQTILVAQNTIASTVKITPALSKGSGFYIGKNKILTNWHVISTADTTVKITRYDDSVCTAKITYQDEVSDLALLTTDCTGIPIPLAAKSPKLGTTVLAAGNPSPFDFHITKGIIGSTSSKRLYLDIWVNNGSSGGPLVNLSGEVVGVMVSKAKEYESIGGAIPIEIVKRFLERTK